MNPFLLNPALAGIEEFGEFRLGAVQQWVGFKGAPKGVNLTYSQGFRPEKGSSPVQLGLGGLLFSESAGPLIISGVGARFSNHLPLVGSVKIGIGVGVDMLHYRFNPLSLNLVDPADPAMAENVVGLWMPSLDGGLLLYNEQFYLAGSARQLLQERILLNDANPVVSTLKGHYAVQAGYQFAVSEGVVLAPSLGGQVVSGIGLRWDIGLKASYRRKATVDMRFRPGDALIGCLGLRFGPRWSWEYAYELPASSLRIASSGSHCFMFSWIIGKPHEGGRQYFW